MLHGIDISGYQGTSYSTAGLSFVGIKLTEGLSWESPNWVGQRATARSAGLVTIFYHYPHIANSPEAEFDYYLSKINLVPGDVLALDWEWYGQNVTDQQARDYKDRWIARARQKAPNHRVIVYADVNNWKNVDQDSNCGDGLWIADYVTAGAPRVSHPWVIHQYSDSARQGGDADVANFNSLDDLRAWAEGMDTMPISDADAQKIALAVNGYKNPATGPDLWGKVGDIHAAVVEKTWASQIDGGKHSLGEHEVATNANAIQTHAAVDTLTKAVTALAARVDAIAKKVGA